MGPKHLLYGIIGFFCGLFLLLPSACSRDGQGTPNGANAVAKDSVAAWIARGKNAALSMELRRQALQKAYPRIKAYKNDSAKTRALSQLSLAYLRLDDSLAFRNTNRETLLLAKRIGDSMAQAETHWDLAEFFRAKAVPDSAYAHFSRAQKIYTALKEGGLSGTMLYNMAIVQADVKDYTGSEIVTIRAIEMLKPLDEYEQLYKCYNNLGTIAIELKEYDRALGYYQTALGYLDNLEGRDNLLQVTQNNIGLVYQEQGAHQKAIPYFKEVLAHKALKEADPLLYAKALSNLAYSQFKANDNGGLPGLFNKAVCLQDSIGDLYGVARTHYNMAEYYLVQKDTAMGLANLQKAKDYAVASGNNKRVLQTLKLFPHLDPKNMYAYVKEYIALDDSLQQEERRVRDKFARIAYETDEVIAKNQLLDRQRQLWAWIAFGSILLAGAVFVIINQIRRNQKLRFLKKQQENNQEIFELMLSQKGKLEEGKHLEQQRVSEELHDGILGQMLGIRLVLTGLNSKTDGESIVQRAELIRKLQALEEEIRTISHELSASSSEKIHNFIMSLQDLVKSVEDATKINIDFGHDHEVDWDKLKGDIKINLYRIVQELLQNCAKHANAKNVSMDFSVQKAMLHITIADDGKGFDTSKGKRGIGMKNISSRIGKINGTWHINSKIGQGTVVHIEVPAADLQTVTERNVQNQILQKA